jgi:hypothetical protein
MRMDPVTASELEAVVARIGLSLSSGGKPALLGQPGT